jgi:hypothetical protein
MLSAELTNLLISKICLTVPTAQQRTSFEPIERNRDGLAQGLRVRAEGRRH